MRCLQCGKRLSLLKKLQDAEFCSEEHRLAFQQQHSHLALTRLMESQRRMDRPAALPVKRGATLYHIPPPMDDAPEAGFLPPVVFKATAHGRLSPSPPPLPAQTPEDLPEPEERLAPPAIYAPQVAWTMSPSAFPARLLSYATPRLRYVVRSPRLLPLRHWGLSLSSTLFPIGTRPAVSQLQLRPLAIAPRWTPAQAQDKSLLCSLLVPDFAPVEAQQPEPVVEVRVPGWAPAIEMRSGVPVLTSIGRPLRWAAHEPLPLGASETLPWRPSRPLVELSPRLVSSTFGIPLPLPQPPSVRFVAVPNRVLELGPGDETLPVASVGPAQCGLRCSVTQQPILPPTPRALANGAAVAATSGPAIPACPPEATVPRLGVLLPARLSLAAAAPARLPELKSVPLEPAAVRTYPDERPLASEAPHTSQLPVLQLPPLPPSVDSEYSVPLPLRERSAPVPVIRARRLGQRGDQPAGAPVFLRLADPEVPAARLVVAHPDLQQGIAETCPEATPLDLPQPTPSADPDPVAPPPRCERILPMPLIRPVHFPQPHSEPAGAPIFVRMEEPSVPAARLEVDRPGLSHGMAKLAKSAILARVAQIGSSVPGRRFWATAPADLKWIGVGLPLVVALVVYSVLPPSQPERTALEQDTPPEVIEPVQNQVAVPPPAPAQPAKAKLGGLRQAILTRAAVDYLDDFRGGLSAWQGDEDWARTWTYNQAQFIEPGRLALYSPTLPLADYSLEFLGQIGRRSLSWVFRAKDLKNYYAMRIVSTKVGYMTQASIVRYVVVDGKKGPDKVLPLPLTIQQDALLRVRLEVRGNNFTTWVQEQVVDSFTDDHHPIGGVGFFTPQGDRALLRWVEVKHQYDFLGRLCAMFAPYGVQADGRIAE